MKTSFELLYFFFFFFANGYSDAVEFNLKILPKKSVMI